MKKRKFNLKLNMADISNTSQAAAAQQPVAQDTQLEGNSVYTNKVDISKLDM